MLIIGYSSAALVWSLSLCKFGHICRLTGQFYTLLHFKWLKCSFLNPAFIPGKKQCVVLYPRQALGWEKQLAWNPSDRLGKAWWVNRVFADYNSTLFLRPEVSWSTLICYWLSLPTSTHALFSQLKHRWAGPRPEGPDPKPAACCLVSDSDCGG